MPIFAKNIIVGAKSPTVHEKENKQPKTFESVKAEARQKNIKQEVTTPPEDEQKYIYKEDGELIRHINKKSHYLRDVLDLDS